MRNKGINSNRLKREPLEQKFAKLWEKDNHRKIGNGILDYLLAQDPNYPRGEVTPRDREVAATVIQWLGSPVGISFLEEIGFKRGKGYNNG